MLNNILIACAVMGVLGLLFGIILTVASKVFAVEEDPKIAEVREALPGANCGGCGKAGCDAMAAAIVNGEAPVNGCPVGGADAAAKIAAILGQEVGNMEKQVAYVGCHGCKEDCTYKFEYYGEHDCVQAAAYQGGDKACENCCLGMGSCVKVCKFDAIKVNEKGVAEVDPEKCTSCGACINICPKGVIKLTPYSKSVAIACSNKNKGKAVKAVCTVGCIGCGICEKNCPFEAVKINKETNLPEFDYEKCKGCGVCAEKCPQNAIAMLKPRKKAKINPDNCVGCGLCKKNCPKEAIEGELKQPHKVDEEKCIGCGVCAEKCKKGAVTLQ